MAYNLADFVEHTVDAVPERTALVCGARAETYGELEERANRLAHHLAAQGIGERDHVAIYSHNSLEFVETMLASYKLRAVPVNVNYRYVEDELVYVLANADAAAVVVEAEFAPKIEAVRDRLPLLRHVLVVDASYEEALAAASAARDFAARSADDLYILYTGGTTGFPKGVVWRHEDVWRTLGGGIDFITGERITDEYAMSRLAAEAPPTVALVLAPLMHGAAQWGTLGGLFKGATVVLLPRFDADEVWKTVERYRIGGLAITGDAMARPMIDALIAGHYDTSSLVAVSSTAAVFSPVVKDQLFDLLPGVMITEAVGSSESGFNGIRLFEKGATASGEGVVTVSLGPDTLILGDDLEPVAPGEIGRMARGGNVPLGYYKDPERTAATFVEIDGRRYAIPGDFARLELDGRMTLLGRGSQCINSGGEKIYPEEVESVLKAHAKVFDALVVGVDDERWGQAVAAVVQARPGEVPTLRELDEHCRARLAGYKVPRRLVLVGEIPRQPSGKPDYPSAKRAAQEGRTWTTA